MCEVQVFFCLIHALLHSSGWHPVWDGGRLRLGWWSAERRNQWTHHTVQRGFWKRVSTGAQKSCCLFRYPYITPHDIKRIMLVVLLHVSLLLYMLLCCLSLGWSYRGDGCIHVLVKSLDISAVCRADFNCNWYPESPPTYTFVWLELQQWYTQSINLQNMFYIKGEVSEKNVIFELKSQKTDIPLQISLPSSTTAFVFTHPWPSLCPLQEHKPTWLG